MTTASAAPIPAQDKVDERLVKKALKSLLKYHNDSTADSKDLLGSELPVHLQFSLNVAPPRGSFKPIRIMIPHPLHKVKLNSGDDDDDDLEEPEVCLIVKNDGTKERVKEMVDNFPKDLFFIKKILTLDSLRTKHKSFAQRRVLLQKYSLFLADDRITPMLTSALGKHFLQAKKQPLGVNLGQKGEVLPVTLIKALSCTRLVLNSGNCITIPAGHTTMSVDKLSANFMAVIAGAVAKIPKQWANIRGIHCKTATSTALPLYYGLEEDQEELKELAGMVEAAVGEPVEETTNKAKDTKKRSAPEPSKEETIDPPKRKKTEKSPLLRAMKEAKKERKEKKASEEPVAEKPKKRGRTKAPSEPSTKATSSKDENFMPSKKFTGSKKGFIFQLGRKGLGYYRDNPPVVDKMALAALARMQERKGKRRNKR